MTPDAPTGPLARSARAVRRARRTVLVHRRGLAALLTATAVLTGLRTVQEPTPPTSAVVVAARDLAGGSVVTASDLRTAQYADGVAPRGATSDPTGLLGRVLAAPLRSGEPVTDVRLVAPGLLDGYPGDVAVPVRVADRGAVSLLHVGDRIDLVAVSADDGQATLAAAGAPVVALPRSPDDGTGVSAGGLVVVAVARAEAERLAEASVGSVLSVVLAD